MLSKMLPKFHETNACTWLAESIFGEWKSAIKLSSSQPSSLRNQVLEPSLSTKFKPVLTYYVAPIKMLCSADMKALENKLN